MKSNYKLIFFCAAASCFATAVDLVAQEKPVTSDIESRESAIFARPPRVGPLDPGQLDDTSRETVEELWKALGVPPREQMPEYFMTMLKHPELMLRQAEFSIQLFKGELSVRDRELAILRLAWLLQAPYEWGEHVPTGKRAGISDAEIEQIIVGSSAPQWSDHDRAIMRAVEELQGNAMISEETWNTLARAWNEKQLLEFPLLLGFYQGIAYIQNSVGFTLEPGNSGLSER